VFLSSRATTCTTCSVFPPNELNDDDDDDDDDDTNNKNRNYNGLIHCCWPSQAVGPLLSLWPRSDVCVWPLYIVGHSNSWAMTCAAQAARVPPVSELLLSPSTPWIPPSVAAAPHTALLSPHCPTDQQLSIKFKLYVIALSVAWAPQYLSELLHRVADIPLRRRLRSSTSDDLYVCIRRRSIVRCCRPKDCATLYPTTSHLHHLFLFSVMNWRQFYFRNLSWHFIVVHFVASFFMLRHGDVEDFFFGHIE